MSKLKEVWTLGPKGTNCEAAANYYLRTKNDNTGCVCLSKTLELALMQVLHSPDKALLCCIAYPDLHNIIFNHLDTLELSDIFIFGTHNMVVASRDGELPDEGTVVSHPAPSSLIKKGGYHVVSASSNAEAAIQCMRGDFNACVTTAESAKDNGLIVIYDYGSVNMGFTLHTPKILSEK